jgi:23S rRNA (adenine2503-C2)-methyltransferase
MRYKDRATVCISSQAGCAMGCTFATGQAGFERHLDAGEICEQVLRAARAPTVGNVSYMGMGGPSPTWNQCSSHSPPPRRRRLLGPPPHVSTVGVVRHQPPAEFPLPVTLRSRSTRPTTPCAAVSSRWIAATRSRRCSTPRACAEAKGDVTFECAASGTNDHPHQADALADHLRGFRGAPTPTSSP